MAVPVAYVAALILMVTSTTYGGMDQVSSLYDTTSIVLYHTAIYVSLIKWIELSLMKLLK
jgi:hypothetical protein